MATLNPEINVFFLTRIKHSIEVASGASNWDKGVEVKDSGDSDENFEAAKQSYHAYMGAYAYGHDANVDFVHCEITDLHGSVYDKFKETWWKKAEPEQEEE